MQSPYSIPVLAELLRSSPLQVMDVGAAGGPQAHWHAPAGLVKVFGFEPNPDNFRALPQHPDWTYHQLALSDRESTETFHAHGRVGSLEESRTVEYVAEGKVFDTIEVEVRTLQALRSEGAIPAMEVIKTDAEYHDLNVLRGAGPYLAEETLCVRSEFAFNRNISHASFGPMDEFLSAGGLLLFTLSTNRGMLGELRGGDFLYLRDFGTVLAGPAPDAVKRERLLKLYVLASIFRFPRYAYSLARAAEDSGVLGAGEGEVLRAAVLRRPFLPAVLRPGDWRPAFVRFFVALATIVAGPAWGGKSGPGANSLAFSRKMFASAHLLPGAWNRRYAANLEDHYKKYCTRRGLYYAAAEPGPGDSASAPGRPQAT